MQQVSMQLAHLPYQIIFAQNGMIGFQPMGQFKPIVEYFEDSLVVIDSSGIMIDNNLYEAGEGINYKNEPKLLKWLQSLNLEMPNLQPQGFPFGFYQT